MKTEQQWTDDLNKSKLLAKFYYEEFKRMTTLRDILKEKYHQAVGEKICISRATAHLSMSAISAQQAHDYYDNFAAAYHELHTLMNADPNAQDEPQRK